MTSQTISQKQVARRIQNEEIGSQDVAPDSNKPTVGNSMNNTFHSGRSGHQRQHSSKAVSNHTSVEATPERPSQAAKQAADAAGNQKQSPTSNSDRNNSMKKQRPS